MLGLVLIVVAALFVLYALFTQYERTVPGEPVLKRVWAALVAAALAAVGAITSWLHGATAP